MLYYCRLCSIKSFVLFISVLKLRSRKFTYFKEIEHNIYMQVPCLEISCFFPFFLQYKKSIFFIKLEGQQTLCCNLFCLLVLNQFMKNGVFKILCIYRTASVLVDSIILKVQLAHQSFFWCLFERGESYTPIIFRPKKSSNCL